MEFLPPAIDRYSAIHTSPENDLLVKINRETHLEVLKPRMLSGHLQGRLLSMISQLHRPKRILEIGTYTGYAALCMAEGLPVDGKLFTIDKNEELEKRVRAYFDESPYSSQIELLIGDALEIIPGLNECWDLVFIDADKENYLSYYERVIDNTNSNGLIIADNVLWSGKVTDKSKQDHDTNKIREFNDIIQEDNRVENVLLPVRDGLMMIRKK